MTHGPTKPDLLIVDDEVQIRRLLRLTLESAGYRVREAENGALGLNEAAVQRPDAVILDLSLPDLSGLEVLRRLREWSQIPILILSVHGEEANKIAALDAGADDYLTKPFGGGELLARMRVLLRRAQPAGEASVVCFGDVEVDLAARIVRRAGAGRSCATSGGSRRRTRPTTCASTWRTCGRSWSSMRTCRGI
jgi:two-component system KDP operon response regulator KdpE